MREQRRAVGYAAWERRAERPMLVLALVFLVVLVVPMVADLPPAGGTAFTVADVAIWAAFAVDYVARPYLAPARWRFVRSHLLDLLVLVVPFLRPLRALGGELSGIGCPAADHDDPPSPIASDD